MEHNHYLVWGTFIRFLIMAGLYAWWFLPERGRAFWASRGDALAGYIGIYGFLFYHVVFHPMHRVEHFMGYYMDHLDEGLMGYLLYDFIIRMFSLIAPYFWVAAYGLMAILFLNWPIHYAPRKGAGYTIILSAISVVAWYVIWKHWLYGPLQ